MLRFFTRALLMAAVLAAPALADAPASKPIRPQTRVMIMRGLNAEFVYVRAILPLGKHGLKLKNGALSPEGSELRQVIAQNGVAARPGDRAQITDVLIKDKSVIFEINGGPKKGQKWYQRIQVGGMGGTAPIAQPDSDPRHGAGSAVTVEFDKFVPDLTVDEMKQVLAPVFDFHSKSAAEVFLEKQPPKIREAIANHQALVGMNRELVTMSKGRPEQKIREKENNTEYEEWVFGHPPQEVEFVRFVGDEVIQIKTMTVDGRKMVRTEKEIDLGQPAVAATAAGANGTQPGGGETADASKPQAKKPTLRRPGEEMPERDRQQPSRMPPPPKDDPRAPNPGNPLPPPLD